jgi:type I restriction enzyme S subunit
MPLRSVSISEFERASLRKDDVVITTSGDCGYSAHINAEPTEQTIASNFVRILRFDLARVEPRFAFRFIHSESFRQKLMPYIRGTTLKNLSLSTAAERIHIPLPPLAEQRRIAEVLDRAEALRAKRRAALAQLDSLTQSLFLDLFGDPVRNPHGMRKSPLGNLIKLKSGEFLPAENMAQSGQFPVYGGNGINGHHDQFLFDEEKIVVGRVGAYCGCVHVTPRKSWITDNAMYVSERSDDVEFFYIFHALTHAKLNRYASQSGQPLVSGSRIYPVELLVPPLPLQREFARRVTAVEALKTAQRASLAELDALFATLQHRAFKGEL